MSGSYDLQNFSSLDNYIDGSEFSKLSENEVKQMIPPLVLPRSYALFLR